MKIQKLGGPASFLLLRFQSLAQRSTLLGLAVCIWQGILFWKANT